MPEIFNFTESADFPGYYIIPDFNQYAISIDGSVINVISGKKINPVISKPSKKSITGGYRLFRLIKDGKKYHRGRHVLLCRAFKKSISGHSIVNHINGIPGDDWLENLEWSTYSKNTQHAYDNGLYPNKTKKIFIGRINGSFESFISIAAASRSLAVCESTVRNRLTRTPKVLFSDGWGVGLDNDSWSSEVRATRETYPIRAMDIETGTTTVFSSVYSAATKLGLNDDTIHLALKRSPSITGGYQFGKIL